MNLNNLENTPFCCHLFSGVSYSLFEMSISYTVGTLGTGIKLKDRLLKIVNIVSSNTLSMPWGGFSLFNLTSNGGKLIDAKLLKIIEPIP